jgi:Uma2 family endonuclease
MSEDEFVAWCTEDTRAEFVDGRVILMSPVSLIHDAVDGFLFKLLGLYLEYRPEGRLLRQPYQVRLRPGLRREPDMTYVSAEHLDRLGPTGLEGAPDAAWEIVSPDSVERDWRDKYHEYETAGVREYWIIDPAHQEVRLYRLADGTYQAVEAEAGCLVSGVIPGFWIRPEWLWEEPPPKVMECLSALGIGK